MYKLLIVEDHALVREGLLQSLQKLERGVECRGAADAEEALRWLESDGAYDLCLLDLMLPGLNGMGCLGVLRKRFPAMPVVILSALDDLNTVDRAMRAGAAGFVSKSSSSDVLCGAIRQVLKGEPYLPPTMRKEEDSEGGNRRRGRSLAEQYNLTPAQMRVLEPILQGKTNRQVSELLGLTEGTVKVHVSAILKALNVKNRSQAMLLAKQHKSIKL